MKVLLNTGSTIDEGRLAKGGDKITDDYTEECAVCWISPVDFEALGCPGKVKVTSKDEKYSVAVYTICTDTVMRGDVFMPRAIWSNVIIDPDTFSTGSPLYKGSPVAIEPTEDEVLSAEDIVLKVYMGGK
ncbi:MAG: formylmethanofuran dehydrogenase [Methanosarcinaceae archaeon]|nr:formylmethanofuran dehydrogenase [Methanosarcinaceae archaeon]